MVEPFFILTDKAYVAIPHTYIPVSTLHSYNSYVTLGQEWDEKVPSILLIEAGTGNLVQES